MAVRAIRAEAQGICSRSPVELARPVLYGEKQFPGGDSEAIELASLQICSVLKHSSRILLIEIRTFIGRIRRKNFAALSVLITSDEAMSEFDCLPGIGQASATVPDGSSCPECRLWVETTRTAQ